MTGDRHPGAALEEQRTKELDMVKKKELAGLTLDIIAWTRIVAATKFSAPEDVAPVLGCVHLSTEDGKTRVVATDRYMIVRADIGGERVSGDAGDGWVIPSKIIKRIELNVRALGGYHRSTANNLQIILNASGGDLTASVSTIHGSATVTGKLEEGAYPSVVSMYPTDGEIKPIPAGVALNSRFLARLNGWPAENGWPWEFASIPSTKKDPRTHPLLARLTDQQGVTDVLIQPVMPDFRTSGFTKEVLAAANSRLEISA